MFKSKHPDGARPLVVPACHRVADAGPPAPGEFAGPPDEAPADPDKLKRELQEVERDARSLPWSPERPWLATTHVRVHDGAVELDLHDLSKRLALLAMSVALAYLPGWQLVVIHGRGRRSKASPVLRAAVRTAIGILVAHGLVAQPIFEEGRVSFWVSRGGAQCGR